MERERSFLLKKNNNVGHNITHTAILYQKLQGGRAIRRGGTYFSLYSFALNKNWPSSRRFHPAAQKKKVDTLWVVN